VQQVPFRGPTSIMCHCMNFSHPGDLAAGTCAPLQYGNFRRHSSGRFFNE
jgi:hypothetical protein